MHDDGLEHRITGFLSSHGAFEDTPVCRAGDVFDEWRIVSFLGRGGSGEVYRAEHVRLGTVVALKILVKDSQSAAQRFAMEAKVLSESCCAAFPRFFGYGEANGRLYLAQELLEPLDLPSRGRSVAAFLLKVCEAVGELHRMGFVHRDIKPMNIMRRPVSGEPVLIDLGLLKGRDVHAQGTLASPSIVDGHAVGVGTPGFSAPEQFTGGEVSVAADIHALGAIANACFKGKPPRCWARIIRRATSSIPSQRFTSVAAFARAIRNRHRLAIVGAATLLVGLTLAILSVGLIRWYAQMKAGWQEEVAEMQNRALCESILGIASPQDTSDTESVTWDDLCKPQVKGGDLVARIELKGRYVQVADPVVLRVPVTVDVFGPGTLDLDATADCKGAAICIRRRGVLLERTRTPYPKSKLLHVVDDDSYLNFVNLADPGKVKDNGIRAGEDANRIIIRYGGPLTLREAQIEHYRGKGLLK